MKESITISTYQPFPSNAWVVAAIIDSHLVTRTYYGFTKRHAIQLFKREMERRKQ